MLYQSQNVTDGDTLDVSMVTGGPLLSLTPAGQFILGGPGEMRVRARNADGFSDEVRVVITSG